MFLLSCINIGFGAIRLAVYDDGHGMLFILIGLAITGINFVEMWRNQQARRQMLTHTEEGKVVTPEEKARIEAKARNILERVVRAVGAKEAESCDCLTPPSYALTVRGQEFFVDGSHILHVHKDGMAVATCYQIAAPVPRLEKIAVALLRLHHAPDQFFELKNNQGHWIV